MHNSLRRITSETVFLKLQGMNKLPNHRPIRNWPEWDAYVTSAQEIPESSQRALLYREKHSHRGIANLRQLRELKARQINQEFLNEICELEKLEFLELDVVTAIDLAPLMQLTSLKTLTISGIRKAEDLSPLSAMHWLDNLWITQAKHLFTLSFLSQANHLQSLGVEGSMWTQQKIESLKPIRGLESLEHLFMASVVLQEKDLSYLAELPKLMSLDCARFAGKAQFDLLRQSLPNLECRWCDSYELK